MFELKIDGIAPLLEKFDKLSKKVEALHRAVPEQLVAWQREDMRRKYPNMTESTSGTETSATTLIWPRSRQPSKDRHHRRQQGPKQYRPAKRGPVVRSNRPILREELKEQLQDRMTKLTAEATKWP